MTIRVRIAPSPTGSIHVGLARTALYNALFAKQRKGVFVLRIEDTDVQRNLEKSEREIYEGLRWLGLDWDEGPDRRGEYGPYRQSERTEIYRKYLEQLLAENAIYPCFCTQEELERERTEQQKRGAPPVYSGRCRKAPEEQRKSWKAEGKTPIYRFAAHDETIAFDDLVRGHMTFQAQHIGDFSVARDFEHPLYNFAAAADDALMHITHVIRGEEHLSNTPKQILILQALGFSVPIYGHAPLLLNAERKKLSKRDGATSVGEYRQQGFLPEALLNFLALLGWHPKDEREQFTFDELVEVFRLDDVQKAGAVFDRKKLESINAAYLRALPAEVLIERAGDMLQPFQHEHTTLTGAVRLVQDRLVTLRELPEALQFLLHPAEYVPDLLVPQKGSTQQTRGALASLREFFGSFDTVPAEGELKQQTLAWIHSKGATNMEMLWPLRVALTGLRYSPDVFGIAAILGKEEVLRRIDAASAKLETLA